MRDRLIEILNEYDNYYDKVDCLCCDKDEAYCSRCWTNSLAGFLLSKGVIVPPCKIGDDLYWINDETNEVEKQEKGITGITLCPNGKWEVIDPDGISDLIGTKYAYLSREEAEKALKGGAE